MARDIETNITANDRTGNAVNSAIKNYNKLDERTKKIAKNMGDLPFGAIGGKAGSDLAKGIAKGLAPVAQYALPILGAIGIGAAPLIGASIAGAIIGGAGIGGVVGGVLLASKDARVQSAFDGLSTRLEARLLKAGGSFVEPTIQGIRTIEKSLDTIDFAGIFKDAARYVDPLARSIGSMVEDLGNGVEKLIRNAGPSIAAIADGIEDMGEALGTGLESLADNGEGAADALRTLFGIINSSISGTLQLVNVLTELYEINRKIGGDTGLRLFLKAMGQDLDDVGENGRKAGSGTFGAADGITKAGDAAEQAAAPVKSLAEKMEEASSAARSLYDSQTTVGEAMKRASNAAKENGKTLSSNSEKGRENRQALSGLASALNRNYNEYVKVNGAGAKAEGIANRNYNAFVKAARGFGLSTSAAKKLAGSILGIPAKRETKSAFDASKAKRDIAIYKNSIGSIPSYKRTTVEIAAKVTGSSLGRSALSSALNKQSLKFSTANFTATGYAQRASDGEGGTLGGATPVDVTNNLTVFLDGKYIDAKTATAITAERRRNQYRQSVGKRY